MKDEKSKHTQAAADFLVKRRMAAARLANSGIVVSKTGGAYRDPASIICSKRAQEQLRTIAVIRERKQI